MYSSVRCVQGAPITLTFQSVDATGEAAETDPGAVTVTVVRADGTVVATGAATSGSGTSPRTYTLSSTVTATLDELSVSWLVGAAVVSETTVHIVGRPYLPTTANASEPFGIREYEPSLADQVTYPTATLVRCRNEVEDLVERACGHVISFVPRFAVADTVTAGYDTIRLPHAEIRAVRWVSYTNGAGAPTSIDISAGVKVASRRTVRLQAGAWPSRQLRVGYEHGLDAPPDDLKAAVARAVRQAVNRPKSAIDSRAISYTTPGGDVQRFPTPGLGPFVTGIPEIDEILVSYRSQYRLPGFA